MVFHRALGAEGVLRSNSGDVTAVVVDDVIDGRPLVVDLDHDGVSCGLQHNPIHAIQRRRVWWVSLNRSARYLHLICGRKKAHTIENACIEGILGQKFNEPVIVYGSEV